MLSAFLGKSAPAAVFALVLTAAACILRIRRRSLVPALCAAAAGLLLGTAVWLCYDRQVRQPLCASDGQTVTLTGTVTAERQRSGDGAVYMLRTRIAGHSTKIEWYAARGSQPPEIGDTVTLRAELTRISPDYRYRTDVTEAASGRYLRIYSAELLELRKPAGFSLNRTLAQYRAYLTAKIHAAADEQEAGMLCAMLFGDKTALSGETKLSLYRSGIGHITAVSGLHLVFFCTVLIGILRRLRCSPREVLLFSGIGIVLFSVIADSAVSVYRAGVMMLLGLAAPVFHRRTDTLRSLCIAVLLLTAPAPYLIGSASFWLSVSGVFGIGIAAPYMTRNMPQGLTKTLAQLCCVSAAVFPASLLLTGETSLLSPVCNLLILPLSIAALYLGLLLVLTGGLTAFLLPAAALLCRMTAVLAQAASALPFSHVRLNSAAVRTAVLIGIPLLLAAFAAKQKPVEITALFLLCGVLAAGLSAAEAHHAAGEFRVAVLGQPKEAVLVASEGQQTVIADLSGAVRNPQYVQKYLRENGLQSAVLLLPDSGNAAAYQAELPSGTVSAVVIAGENTLRAGQKVCGVTPEFCAGSMTARLADAGLTLDGQSAEISCFGQRIAVLPAKDRSPQTASAVIRWGGGDAPDDSCETRLLTAETGNNRLLTVRKNGSVTVQALS